MKESYQKKLIKYKVYLDRARGYIAYVNFLLIGVIAVKQIGINLSWFMYALIVFATLFISLVVGYLDKKYIREQETKEYGDTNPYLKEILKILKQNDCKLK